MNETHLLLGLLLSAIGIGYLVYGRRQQAPIFFIAGLGLLLIPFLIDSTLVLLLAGAGVGAIPFLIKL
jgi:hypothetical protein